VKSLKKELVSTWGKLAWLVKTELLGKQEATRVKWHIPVALLLV
jgi:hypothetical protein